MDFQYPSENKMYSQNLNKNRCKNIIKTNSQLVVPSNIGFNNNLNLNNNKINNDNKNDLWKLKRVSDCNLSSSSSSLSYEMYLEQHQSNLEYFIKTTSLFYSNRFNKFLARFSGRRRRCLQHYFNTFISNFVCLLVIFSLFAVSEACSSRAVPKPRPSPTPTPRPNITFHTYTCPPFYDKWYCINGATCFTVQIGEEILYNCECADGFMGPRCEFKELDGSYLPIRPRALLETASIASGATLALIFVIILCLTLYYRWQQRKKLSSLSSNTGIGVDEIDGIPSQVQCEHHRLRPFGPHHYQTLTMTATVIR